MIKDILKETDARMEKSRDSLANEFQKIRTGRAHPSLLGHVMVDAYGSQMPINQTAQVNAEDARTLSIVPWDKTMVQPIEKAIMKSDLGLTPTTAGTVIRVVLPPLTEERRRDLVKIVKAEAENARVGIRAARRDANSDLKDLEKESEISEDELRKAEADVQKLTDKHVAAVDKMVEDKEQDMMSV